MKLYLSRQAAGPGRYVLEQAITTLAGWIPTAAGIAIRGLLSRLILKMDGMAAVESHVRLRFASNIRLGHGAYLDEGVYLHACPQGIDIPKELKEVHKALSW